MEYFAFGESFVEEHKNSHNSPYKFNGKELDEESGLYYYGARYFDPRTSIWLSVDSLIYDETFLDGEHNGGFYNSFNHGSYIYCYQNPINLIDPNGKQVNWGEMWNNTKEFCSQVGDGIKDTMRALAPIRPMDKEDMSPRYINYLLEQKNKTGLESFKTWCKYTADSIGEAINNLSKLPATVDRIITKGTVRERTALFGMLIAALKGKGATKTALIRNGMSFKNLTVSALSKLISTEKNAQPLDKIKSLAKEMKEKGQYAQCLTEPIYTYAYKGKTYILDGHNRIEAAKLANKPLDVIELGEKSAMKYFPNKVKEIKNGIH